MPSLTSSPTLSLVILAVIATTTATATATTVTYFTPLVRAIG